MLGKIEGRRRGHQRMRRLDGITDAMNMNLGQTPGEGEGQGGLACCGPWGHKESDTTERLNNNICHMHDIVRKIPLSSFVRS